VLIMKFASTPGTVSPSAELWDLAMRCSRAWSSQDPDGMAACYEESGWQSINGGPRAEGPAALARVAASYMEAFPDLQVSLDQLLTAGDSAFFVWTLTGTNTGTGGTGNPVRVSGIEVWKMGASGLIASSEGYYDADTYDRQLSNGDSR
jgi:hypothetical protein